MYRLVIHHTAVAYWSLASGPIHIEATIRRIVTPDPDGHKALQERLIQLIAQLPPVLSGGLDPAEVLSEAATQIQSTLQKWGGIDWVRASFGGMSATISMEDVAE